MEKMVKVDSDVTITFCDNGYMVYIGGYDEKDNWLKTKLVFMNISELFDVLKEIATMEKNS
jgi:hypothetical protein